MQWPSVCLVRNNTAGLAPRIGRFAEDFLERLVQRCPELSGAFNANRDDYRRDLSSAFADIVKQAAKPQVLSTRLLIMSAANERRGLRPHHYHHAREIILQLLAEYNGPAWNKPLADAWVELLDHMLIHLCPPQSFSEALAA